MKKLSEKITSKLKSNTYNSVYLNTLSKLPIVVTGEGTFVNAIAVSGDVYPINNETHESYMGELQLLSHQILNKDYNPDSVSYLRTEIVEWMSKKCRLVNVKKFHYDDTWYSHKLSVDYPEESFGILKIENLPYRPLDKLMNKKSFICRMDQLMFNNLMQPFMLFVDYKFVNWNDIDVVFDCDDSYLLLHGTKYNYYELEHLDIHMVILPFKVEYVGEESNAVWNKNYEMLQSYMQDSLHMNIDDRIEIDVPTMYSIYQAKGMVYNVGAWMYTQIRANYMGLLTDEQISKLKNIELNRYIYDDAGNIINTYSTRFNALDRDVYDVPTYENICHCSHDFLVKNSIMRFNTNGLLDDNGINIIANLDESLKVLTTRSSEKNIIIDQSDIDSSIFRENHIMFKEGKFDPECGISEYDRNISMISNHESKPYVIKTFIPAMIEDMITLSDAFINKKYYVNQILNYLKSDTPDDKMKQLISKASLYLNYSYFDNLLYQDNFKQGYNAIMDYNPLFFNDLIDSAIKSTTVPGKQANESLTFDLGTEKRKGLKIPRYKYSDHETYVIVFVNGELISTYSDMYVASNYFFIPIEKEFAGGDVIEFLYFTKCDNNEIHFEITDNMLSKLKDDTDPEFVKSTLFKEYINPDDTKIFAEYPEEIMIYKDLIDKSNDIAFNISYRNSANELLLFKDVVKNKSNKFTAVSSRKFIYERLYVDQWSYRIELDERFRYCDNQKQYLLFINGRRIEDDGFLITVPKYSRPFWGMYLYTAKFVKPEDRIELFYVPEELINANTDYELMSFNLDGYIETDKKNLSVPYNPDFYLYFVNGKKIPNSDLIPIDSHTLRVKSDTKTLLKFNVNPIYRNVNTDIAAYLKGKTLSKYDDLIQYIKDTEGFGYDELDHLFNSRVKMSDVEKDMIKWNVDRIAIINEIVRDFWVTSGYEYNEKPFVYDYALDEIIVKDDRTGNYILPALDATPEINILKNHIYLLYFNISKSLVYEIGGGTTGITFTWEFSKPLGHATITVVKQTVDGKEIGVNDRSYTCNDFIGEDRDFYFKFDTMATTIDKRVRVRFYNGIYYGSVDEDILQHFGEKTSFDIKDIIAVVPKDKIVPFSAEQIVESETVNILRQDNDIIADLHTVNEKYYKEAANLPSNIQDLDDPNLVAILSDGRMLHNLKVYGANTGLGECYYGTDLPMIMPTLNKVLQDDLSLDFDKYKIGSNNYFVYACPKRLAYDSTGKCLVHFVMPDINSREIIDYGKDDLTVPVYTDGTFDNQNRLNELSKCEMKYLAEFDYRNPSGYEEKYVMWRSNGFFTRKYDDYEFPMKVLSEDDFIGADNTKTDIPETQSNISVRAVNTSSPTGTPVNDNIVFIDGLIL